MSYASVLLPFNLDSDNLGLLKVAHEFAERFDAWQIGIAAGANSLPYFAEGPIANDLIEQTRANLVGRFESIERSFRQANEARSDRIEFRCAERLPDGFVISAVSEADLVIVERTPRSANLMHGVDIGNLLMQAGRPVLFLSADTDRFVANKVVVAWKDTREARRAVLDALPILRLATEVSVLEILESDAERADAHAGADALAIWLGRHGIRAVPHVSRETGHPGELIDRHALKIGADIVVAGGYGRSRLLEWLFGGVTRHLLWQSRLAVLLSH